MSVPAKTPLNLRTHDSELVNYERSPCIAICYGIGNKRQVPELCKPLQRSEPRHGIALFTSVLMGKKTDKKIKSERINALRKQYDSFLEEDKKRKERNDYILGRLDKMRYSNMAVQLHPTPTSNRDFLLPSFSRHSYQAEKLEPTTVDRISTMQLVHANQPISRPGYQSSPLGVTRNYLEEASILNEISKKYILIPKLNNTFPNTILEALSSPVAEPVSSDLPHIDNNDWKSKYDILKQIKSEEKEVDIPKSSSQEPTYNLGNDKVRQNYNQEDINTTYENEIPVKDVTDVVGIEIDLKQNCVLSANSDQIQISDGARDLNADSLAQSDIVYQNVNDLSENIEHGLKFEEYAEPHEQNFQGVKNNENNLNYQKPYPKEEYFQEISNKDNTGEHHVSNPEKEYDQEASNYINSAEYKRSNPEQQYTQEIVTDHNVVENLKNYPDEEYSREVSNNDNTVEYQASYTEQEYPIEYDQFIPEKDSNFNEAEQNYPDQEYSQEVSNNENNVEYQASYTEKEYPTEYDQFIPEKVANVNEAEQVKPFETINTDSPKEPTYNPDEPAILEYDRVPTSATHIISSTGAHVVDGNMPAEIIPENSDAFAAGIDEFDAEQKELFHPQTTDANSTYYEQGETYNAEYSQEQNYPQAEQYDYYEVPEQKVSPGDINEHEETQQHYDPAYEQQYMSEQTQEEQQYVEMDPNSQLLPDPNYDLNQMQNYDELAYGPPETVMNVEEALTKEEGLADVCTKDEPIAVTET